MPVSIGDALLIVSKICSALDYAHRKKGLDGNDLHLVHRDISPQNILVSYEGEVKLVDFGIAKAAMGGGQETKTGVLKGKLAYMSPEQAWGKPVDGRTDLFALGIVLYEAVTGERLFTGNDEISILEKVRKAAVPPPTQFNPATPSELESILKKAMAKEPEHRYQTASEMEMALEDLITKKGYAFSSLSLSHYMQALFAEEILKDTRRFQSVTRQAPQTAPVEDRSTVARPAHAAPTPVPTDPTAAVRKSISQSKIILPAPKGRRFSRWVSATLFLVSWSVFLLLLFLSDISFVARLRSKFPVLEESKVRIAAYLEGTGLLGYLDGFKNGLFRLAEMENPEPSAAASPSDESVAVTLARPESEPIPPPAPPDTAGPEIEAPPAAPAASVPDIPNLYREAKEDYNAGRLDDVERKLRQIIEADPNEIQAYHLLGTVFQEKKEPDQALRIFADAAARFPKDATLHYDLGFLYFNKGIDSLAVQELSLAVKLSQQSPEAERAREILRKLEQRPPPAASLPKRKPEPPRAPAAPPLFNPKPEPREEPAEKPESPPLPSAAIPPSPSSSAIDDQEQIRFLISNQKRGFENKNMEGILQGHLQPLPAFRQKVGQWFERFDRLSVNYEIYDVKLEGKEASVSLLQTMVFQSDTAARQVEKALVVWKMIKIDEGWKIAKVNVVEKY